MQIMSHRCRCCQKPFTGAGSRRHHERHTCWKRLENGQGKLPLVDFPPSPAETRVDAPKITLPTENQNGIHRQVMKTLQRFVDEDDMDFDEPAESAVAKRKLLLNRVMKKKLLPDESNDDEEEEVEEVEASV